MEDIAASMGTVGDAFDNSLMGTIDGPHKTIAEVEYPAAGWIDWYNNRSPHGSLEMVPPIEHEQAHYAALNREPQPA